MRTTFVAALLLAACSGDGGEEVARGDTGPSLVVPHRVQLEQNARTIKAVGTARARAAAVVRPETAGIVETVLFSAGDFVEAGEPLVALEAEDERLAVREAEQLLARYRRIEDTGAVSDTAIDEARTQLEAARINLEQAELRLSERTARAPFAGYVGLTDVDPGGRVTQDTVLTAIDDRRILQIDFSVPEEVFGRLNSGDRVTVSPFSGGEPRQAEVVLLDSRVDPQSRAFRVRASLPNEDDELRPGMSFEVSFDISGARLPSVPEASIVWGASGAYVWAVENGAAKRVPVGIVSRREGGVLVDADLPAGSLVIAEGVQKVREGGAVRFEGGGQQSSAVSSAGSGAL